MAKLILIRAAETDWQAQGRLAGDTDLHLNEIGHRQAAAAAHSVAGLTPRAIHCGPDQATQQTAAIVADELKLKVNRVDDLREMDLGHWEGLTVESFRERFAKVYRQWRSDPLSVEPPDGEPVSSVSERLDKRIEKILARQQGESIAVVLGRLAYATARCRLGDGAFARFWEYVEADETWTALDISAIRHEARTPPPSAKS